MANDKPTGTAGATAATSMSTTPRIGGAKADFIASLGRKIAELRGVLSTVKKNPESAAARDDLRRKLHALGTGARMLHFEGMARCIVDIESVLERAAEEGQVTGADVERVARGLDDLPALAWGEERPAEMPPAVVPAVVPQEAPRVKALTPSAISVLVVGPEDLADMLVEDMGANETDFECERVDDLGKARSVALAVAPDVIVLDGDIAGSADFAAKLLDDPLTEGAAIVVALSKGQDSATRFTALGVTKVMLRPLLAGALRAACQEAVDQRDGKTIKMTLGEPTVSQLGERLALEIRRALVDAVDEPDRGIKVKLGDGAEVWAALWGAIARVREVVTTNTEGAVQFSGQGPEGAMALAPVLSRGNGPVPSERAEGGGRNRDHAMDVNLTGRRVIVADDDPAVTWFIADLLRTAGCVVHEALDGRTALRMAYELSPELVVSDILMPGLDGFALCRALRKDVALRDTPVILLSWKEDLLQRVRELGASAAAYLRKESDARAILSRVREVMRPRARIAARLQGHSEVRGRLDGITVRTLCELVVAARPAARVSVRDASFLYEVELRGGGIHRATRTSGDGGFLRSERVIPAMLGVGAGRFVVSSIKFNPGDEKTTPLAEQFAKPIAQARSALYATTGARMMTVEKVVLDEDDVSGYVLATPEPARELVQRLARGISPREILLQGDVSPALVEDILSDLATRGAMVAVYRADGSDAMRGEALDVSSILPDAAGGRSSLVPPATAFVPPVTAASERPGAGGGTHESSVIGAMGDESDAPPAEVTASSTVSSTAAATPARTSQGTGDEEAKAASESPVVAPKTESTKDEASSPLAGAKETSIPVTVEPTADLRVRRADGESVPLNLRARAPKPIESDDPSPGFPPSLMFALAVLALVAVALGARFWMSQRTAEAPIDRPAPAVPDAPGVTYDALPPGVTVPAGQGLLTVIVAEGTSVRIDGNDLPRPQKGKILRMPLPTGVHLVATGAGDKARSRILEVRAGRATNLNLDEP